jgi:AcrR family transcriptional regulator
VETKAEKNIINAFLELCLEKNSLKAPVKEICEKAGVSRVSFYTHFEDVEHLLSLLKGRIIAGLDEIVKAWPYIDVNIINKKKPFPMFAEIALRAAQNKKILRVLLTDPKFYLDCEDVCRRLYLDKFRDFANLNERSTAEILAAFVAGGFFKIFAMWANDKIQASHEEISVIMTELVSAIFNSNIQENRG